MKTAFVFPGQGSQKTGMGKDLYNNFEASRNIFIKANEVLGFDIAAICFEGPEEKLKLTDIAQPAILTTSIAALYAFNRIPDYVAGHSLGEYSALVCAGVIDFKDAVMLVHLRGKFMQEAVPVGKGAMAAVLGMDRQKLIDCCNAIDSSLGTVQAANFNSPGQIVISGDIAAVEAAGKLCKEAGAKKTIPLQVSAPFHCSLMQSAADKLKAELEKITLNDAKLPIISNVTAKPVTNANEIKNLLIEQVTSSVLWEDSINKLSSLGVETIVEIGAGKVLAGLIKKTNEHVKVYNIEDSISAKETII